MRPFTAKSAGVPERGHRPGLNIRNSTVYKLIRARKIPTFRVGRSPSAARLLAAAPAGSTAADTKIDFR
jgi:hypothetical protein